jgi:hypothetical protein
MVGTFAYCVLAVARVLPLFIRFILTSLVPTGGVL